MPNAVHTPKSTPLKTLKPAEAREQSYERITTDVVIDSEIFHSMQRSMVGVDAVWVRTGQYNVQLARKRAEIKLTNRD